MDFVIDHSYLIPLLPLLGAVIAGFFGARYLKQQSHWPIWLGVGASAVLSIALLAGMVAKSHEGEHSARPEAATAARHSAGAADPYALPAYFRHNSLAVAKHWYTWIRAGNFTADAGFLFDPLTAVMLCVITGIGFFITVFAKGYMAGEKGYFRFFAYLGLFIFAMTILVLGDNLVMLYLGWEGVGLCSYLLIGYYYERPAAREAAKKAFLVNRVGDFGFGLGIMLIYLVFGTVAYFGTDAHPGFLINAAPGEFLASLPEWKRQAVNYIPFLLMLGAFGKSAQFPLYVWLPDAMEGPTPVSALIHAATMVTAGVYMIARCSTVFVTHEAALTTVACVGAFTAIFAGSIALRQFDLKKVFAYSTVSQLGFMFVGVGVLAPVAGVFHLVTHAFFKALLFLSSGVVMHAMSGELDMRKMSGLKRILPKTNVLMLIGCLALAGFPFFSGFFSKDEIVSAAFGNFSAGERPLSRWILGLVLLFTAFLTAYYTFRLYFQVFQGPLVVPNPPIGGHGHEEDAGHDSHDVVGSTPQRGTAHGHGAHHNHEPASMMLPLIVLAIGAFSAGWLNWHEHLGHFLSRSPSFVAGYNAAEVDLGPNPPMQDSSERTAPAHGQASGFSPAGFGMEESAPVQAREQRPWITPVMGVSALVSIAGIWLAYLLHLKDRSRAERLAERLRPLTRMLEAKFWVDEIYQNGIVEPLRALGRAFFAMDQYVVDGFVWLISFIPQSAGWALKLGVQRGYLQGYAAAMLFGVGAILLIVLLS